jgi:hypothetical protein
VNAPANIPQARRIRMDETAGERAHRRSISIHCPNCNEMEMAARCDIAAIRDSATAAIARVSDSAGVMLGEVSRLATQAVFAPLPFERLLRIKGALTLTMMAVREIERAQRDG